MYKILIVEDNSIITDFLINVISELYPKWSVYNADSYKKAIDIAMNQDIDLFILDYELNKDNLTENGFNLGIELKNIPKYKNTPMVFETSYPNHIFSIINELHCIYYLIKPYEKADIQHMLNKILNYNNLEKRFSIKDSFGINSYINDNQGAFMGVTAGVALVVLTAPASAPVLAVIGAGMAGGAVGMVIGGVLEKGISSADIARTLKTKYNIDVTEHQNLDLDSLPSEVKDLCSQYDKNFEDMEGYFETGSVLMGLGVAFHEAGYFLDSLQASIAEKSKKAYESLKSWFNKTFKGGSGTFEWPSAKGLVGHDFEDYLHNVIGGESRYIKGSTAGRDFDGVFGNRWYEAKSGNYWNKLLQDKSIELKFKQKMAEGLKIAQEYGATYEVFSNSPIPDSIKEWLTKKGIPFTEILN